MKTKLLILLVAFLGMFSNIQAQDATLEETLEFIKLKTLGKQVSSVPTEILWAEVFELDFLNKKIYIGKVDREFNSEEFYIDLAKIRTIDIFQDTFINTSPRGVVETVVKNLDGKILARVKNRNFGGEYGINYGKDAPRVLKAYKHLLDLLGIKLMEEKF